ncbi:MAG: glycosyltransferase family 4 protein [Acidobacteriota bacterium]
MFKPMINFEELNICFIAGTLGQGGSERQLFYMLKSLRECGAQPRLLSLTQGDYWEEPIRELGVPITWVGQQEGRLQRAWRIASELRRDPADIIQSQHFYTNLYAVAAARATGKCEIGALRSDTFSEVQSHAFTGKLSLKAPRRLAANSRTAIRNAVSLGVPAEKLFLLPNVVDADSFQTASRRDNQRITLLAVARLSSEKRVDRFLSLVARLRADVGNQVRGLVVGDGPLLNELQQQATEMNLSSDAVEFRGRQNNMALIYAESDILVMTSEFEGTPNVILEAMAAGLPTVANKVGGVPEVVEHGATGLLADDYDEEQMVELLRQLIASAEMRKSFGQSARRYIEANHALARLPQFLSNLYQPTLASSVHQTESYQPQ